MGCEFFEDSGERLHRVYAAHEPVFRVFREAAVNLLIHQDYADHCRKAVITFFLDEIQFWNPGDVFGDDRTLLQPGEMEKGIGGGPFWFRTPHRQEKDSPFESWRPTSEFSKNASPHQEHTVGCL